MRSFVLPMLFAVALSACDPAPNSAPVVAGREGGNAAAELTLAKFNGLRDGMSYAEAVAVIGFAGTEQSSTALGGTRTVMYAWSNPDGLANMNAMFQDDKLVSKAQFGLK